MRLLSTALLAFVLLAGCSPPTLKARLINAERRARDAEASLDRAEQAMAALEPDEAGRELRRAREALSDPDVGYYPERELIGQRLSADEAKLPAVRKERERRDLELKVAERLKALEELEPRFDRALEGVARRQLEEDAVDGARGLFDDLRAELDEGKELEPRHAEYAAFARRVRQKLERGAPAIALAGHRLEFVEGPGEVSVEAGEVMRRARKERELRRRIDLFEEARSGYARCVEQGKRLLARAQGLSRASILLEGKATTPGAVTSSCASNVRAIAKRIASAQRAEKKSKKRAVAQRSRRKR